MESQGFSLQHFSRPSFLFNRDSPFAPFVFKDVPASPHPSSSPCSPGFPTSKSRTRTQHRYCLTNGNDNGKGNDQAWLTLLVNSRSPKPKLLPLFFGKDAISGRVELELAKPETVREVKVTVRVVFPLHLTISNNSSSSSSRVRQLISPRNRILFLKYHKFY